MADHRPLIRAILANLDDDAPRLVYADALQAEGDPLGEFIVVQCELARLGLGHIRLAMSDCPPRLRRTISADVRRDWIGDAFLVGVDNEGNDDPKLSKTLRRRESALLEEHREEWTIDESGHSILSVGTVGSVRFVRGFVEHADTGGRYSGRTPCAQLFGAAPTMRSLEILLNNDGDAFFKELPPERLTQLRIGLFSADDNRALIEHAEKLKGLRELAIRGLALPGGGRPSYETTPWEGPALDALIRLPFFEQLEALDIYEQPLDAPQRIVESARACKRPLRDLRVGMNRTRGIAALIAGCTNLASLEILDLYQCMIGDEGAEQDMEAIASSPNLKNLRALRIVEASRDGMPDATARMLGDAFPELRVLDFTYSRFIRNAEQVRCIVEGRGLTKLRQLSLRSTNTNDTIAQALAESPLIARLRVLDLGSNVITRYGAAALAASEGAKSLRLLDLRGNFIDPQSRDALKKALPTTRVLTGK